MTKLIKENLDMGRRDSSSSRRSAVAKGSSWMSTKRVMSR